MFAEFSRGPYMRYSCGNVLFLLIYTRLTCPFISTRMINAKTFLGKLCSFQIYCCNWSNLKYSNHRKKFHFAKVQVSKFLLVGRNFGQCHD